MRIFRDTENNNLITESELRKEWDETDIETDGDFEDYILDCTSKNGFLEQVDSEVEKLISKYYNVNNHTITTRFYKKDDSITDMFSIKKIVNMEFVEVGQSKNTKQNKTLKTIIGTAGFLLMIGSVGAMENDAISLTQGIIQDLIGFGMLYWATRGIKW